MNTLTINQPQAAKIDSTDVQNRIYAALAACKKQAKRLSWLFERHPGFAEKHAWDKNIGIEVRRMRY